jgi:hypothetical protein
MVTVSVMVAGRRVGRNGMLRRDTVLVACTMTNLVESVGLGQAAPSTDVSAGRG